MRERIKHSNMILVPVKLQIFLTLAQQKITILVSPFTKTGVSVVCKTKSAQYRTKAMFE